MTQFPIPIEVKASNERTIWIKYSDGKAGEINLAHLGKLKPFQLWNEAGFFEKVFIEENGRCIAWNEELELCPNTLYLNLVGKTYEEYASH